jgi:hypothetical protein
LTRAIFAERKAADGTISASAVSEAAGEDAKSILALSRRPNADEPLRMARARFIQLIE